MESSSESSYDGGSTQGFDHRLPPRHFNWYCNLWGANPTWYMGNKQHGLTQSPTKNYPGLRSTPDGHGPFHSSPTNRPFSWTENTTHTRPRYSLQDGFSG